MIDLYRLLCPYPTIDPGYKSREGFLLSLPRYCIKCKMVKCWDSVPKQIDNLVSHLECHRGFSLIAVKFSAGNILIYGVIESFLNKTCPSKIRKEYRSHKISIGAVEYWRSSMIRVQEILDGVTKKNVVEAISSLHDITTATNIVFRNAEALISQSPGLTDDDKIESSPPALKSLYKAVNLLKSRLTMSSFVANPEAASYGAKRSTPIYRVVDRICRLFEEFAAKKSIGIDLYGSSFNKVFCYDSFESLPLVLIDNAIKYSIKGEVVYVTVNDIREGVEVRVQSKGPIIATEDQARIFEKGYRTEIATKMSSAGSGLGLYIAKIVADAHNIKIQYETSDLNPKGDMGNNIFYFQFR